MTMVTPAPKGEVTTARGALRVEEIRPVADDVVSVTLARPDGSRLPDWAPGAHIDVDLPIGQRRQYSLCGDRWDAHRYRIAVQRESDGGGASAFIHDRLGEGDVIGFGGPRNAFRLAPADEHLFVAGGIGITPVLPMIRQARLLGVPWRLLYLGRTRSRLAFLDELGALPEVTVHCADEDGRADLDAWAPTDPRVRVMSCGPARLLDAVEAWGAPAGGHPPRVERFAAASANAAPAVAFDVVAQRSGATVRVGERESVADALRRAGVHVVTSCDQGVCGTCETDVVEGVPDHRDALLDEQEREAGRIIFPCVSRCARGRLVLDL
ncbi:PDR/VanB family oxidoreductase [Microbacterium karelineae]|uniref:PDR/VanB family oxidoreductase n=1 Tax=Microbacterium karelineae TaxID=2654283 RepID=UPI0012EA93AD|nr:PDR/VanB family oxidoreductase [Microbacterium karelineae]